MRRGNFTKAKEAPKAAVGVDLIQEDPKTFQRRNVVEEVLTMFKKGDRDVKKAIKVIREGENGNAANMR